MPAHERGERGLGAFGELDHQRHVGFRHRVRGRQSFAILSERRKVIG